MNIEVIAQNAIRITTKEEKKIYCDPFKLGDKAVNDADLILITHSHYDHFSPEDISLIKTSDTKIVVTSDLMAKAEQCGFVASDILTVAPNKEYEFGGIKFKTIPAYNVNKNFHQRAFDWVSYILNVDGEVVYIAGDTDITDEALNVDCDIALVPVGGTYTMTADEAAKLVKRIAPRKFAVPTHYNTVVGSDGDARRFKELLDGKVEVKILMEN